jgi:transcriptional regulator GlxA family with amidase domain
MRPVPITILGYDDVEVLDLAGPYEVFTTAIRVAGLPVFEVTTLGTRPEIRARGGLRFVMDRTLADPGPQPDIVLVPGGVTAGVEDDADVMRWLRRVAPGARVVASVCTGAFVLGRAGLLTPGQVTTHWEDIPELTVRHPELDVVGDVRFVDRGSLITSAGISAGIDMALHLVRRLTSPEVARATARQMDYTWDEATG